MDDREKYEPPSLASLSMRVVILSNLNEKELIELASLQSMNVPENTGDLQAASSKKGFTILCKLKLS